MEGGRPCWHRNEGPTGTVDSQRRLRTPVVRDGRVTRQDSNCHRRACVAAQRRSKAWPIESAAERRSLHAGPAHGRSTKSIAALCTVSVEPFCLFAVTLAKSLIVIVSTEVVNVAMLPLAVRAFVPGES